MDFNFSSVTTPRLTIRPFVESDSSDLGEFYSDPDVVKHWGISPVSDRVELNRIIAEAEDGIKTGKMLKVGIVMRETEKLVGMVLLFNIVESSKRAEIGYALSQKYWRNGYMKEALPAFIQFAFNELKLRRLEADVNPKNHPSARLLEQLGFENEGVLRARWESNGIVTDSAIYGLLNPDYVKAEI